METNTTTKVNSSGTGEKESFFGLLGRFDRFSETGFLRLAVNLPFLLLLFLFGTLHIANNHFAENMARETYHTEKELKQLRWEYLSRSSELMLRSKQSEVAAAVAGREMKELRQPPYKIRVKGNE